MLFHKLRLRIALSLIELLIVIAIIALLATMLLTAIVRIKQVVLELKEKIG